MLRKILSPETCAQCRLCCVFDKTDIWELPVLTDENVSAVRKLCSQVSLAEKGMEQTFHAPELQAEELFSCPALSDNGCCLTREDMPFDCRIWPFRMMRDENGKCVIAVSELCKGVAEYSDEQLREFLNDGLGEMCFMFAEEHPDHVKPLADGYRVVLFEK
ncbi:MAG: hypothetical protein IJY74_00795 [Oscillospiraceae bacterium]|nr:hypothetical protein [Oscillospiraceae bacterium]